MTILHNAVAMSGSAQEQKRAKQIMESLPPDLWIHSEHYGIGWGVPDSWNALKSR